MTSLITGLRLQSNVRLSGLNQLETHALDVQSVVLVLMSI